MSKDETRFGTQNPLHTLFRLGVIGGLTDGQLLERCASRRGEDTDLAFAALVDRHGPMVFRVCQRLLRAEHDAQDACQATFLLLASRAGSLWVKDSLGPWLHAVARRTAANLKSAQSLRRKHERRAAELKAQPAARDDREEIDQALHEEIDRLPRQYRAAIVLCDLEGLTQEQAALRLGWPAGTVRSRLARGRARLRERLMRRGLAPALAGLFAAKSAPAAVPAGLAHLSSYLATHPVSIRARSAIPGGPSARVAALSRKTSISLLLNSMTSLLLPLIGTLLVVAAAGHFLLMPRTVGQDSQAGLPSPAAPAPRKPVRALYLQGPNFSWEPRFLNRALDASQEIRVDMRVIRRSADAKDGTLDADFARGRYDVYILSDLPADDLTRNQQQLLVRAVEGGAGLIMLGGRSSFGAGGWARTELAGILPVSLLPDRENELTGYSLVQIKPKNLDSEIMRLGPTRQESRRTWGTLPPVLRSNRFGPTKPGATVMAETPEGESYLVAQDVGQGRVIVLGGATWPWARGPEASRAVHSRFWQQTLRWASHRDPL